VCHVERVGIPLRLVGSGVPDMNDRSQ